MSGAKRVLIVDDDAQIIQALGIRLGAAGFEILSAENGVDGLAAARAERPDAILLDIRMPQMDGLEVLERLRGADDTRDIPVVMLTANVAEKSRNRAAELGARYFLEKPCEPKTLLRAVRVALGLPPCSPEPASGPNG